jgi:hypothetical protein
MPPLNMDLVNDPRLYNIGAGILEIDVKDPVTGLFTGYRDMGNATVVTPTNADERFKKKESRTRFRTTVANLLLSRETNIDVSLDEWSATALRIFFQGTRSAQAAQVATPVVAETLTTAAVLGSSYLTAKVGPITAVTLNNVTTSTPLVLGTDYEISDANVGAVRILDTAANVAAGDEVSISYTPTAYASGAGIEIAIGTVSIVEAAARFIGDPPNGPRLLFDWPLVEIVPNGGLPLITTSNENTPIPLTITVKSDVTNHPTYPIGRILQLPA